MSAAATRTHLRTCHLCEALCGLEIDLEDGRATAVRGDPLDPFSRGHVCPKGVGLIDVQHDPDRLRKPMRREGERWRTIGWDEALAEASERLAGVQRRHGRDAVALYQGNPTTHDYGVALTIGELMRALGTRNAYSTASIDHLPHMLASWEMFGSRALLPVPDVDRTDFMLILGANPAVSNGSVMTAPDIRGRLRRLRERGGRLVVVDPRRTRTAELADRHMAIRPGADALLLLALVRTVLFEGLSDLRHLESFTDGLDALRDAVAPFAPAAVEEATGIAAGDILTLARDFAEAPSAVCYGRLGICQQPLGALCCWLVTALNAITGNLDSVGGSMFTTPAADTAALARLFGEQGSFGSFRSRVSGAPEFAGELPVAVMAEEMLTPGRGQVRALLTIAGNPVLSTPGGARLDEALRGLDLVIAVDPYLNETTRHADLILPPPFGMECDHYPLLHASLAVRDVARYSPAAMAPPAGTPQEWQIVLALASGVLARRGIRGRLRSLRPRAVAALGPRRVLALALRFGPHGAGPLPWRAGLTLKRLAAEPRTVDLGPLRPRQLPRRLQTSGRRLRLAPPRFVDDVRRAHAALREPRAGLVLIGRRALRDNNSWMHNSERLVRGANRCTLLVNPADAARTGAGDGDSVRVRSRAGAVVVPVEVSDEVPQGVASLPHGWGHGRRGTRLHVASTHAGASANDLTDPHRRDALAGTAAVSGVPIEIERT